MTVKDVNVSIGCIDCGNPVTISSYDMEQTITDLGRYACWTCRAELEEAE